MVERLWAPWRLSYVTGDKPDGCVLCAKGTETGDDRDAHVVHRGRTAVVVMNRYPYNNGHVMIVPTRHVADLTELTMEETHECLALVTESIRALRAAMQPEGFNVGLNLGSAAGAGIASHLHWHVVPRWAGDTNFMPVLADVTVMPEHLDTTWKHLVDAFAELSSSSTTTTSPTTPEHE